MSREPTVKPTHRLDNDAEQHEHHVQPDVEFRPVPDNVAYDEASHLPIWRVHFEVASQPGIQFGLDINGEIILGRSNKEPDQVDLNPYEAAELGVSRQHLKLLPTFSNLFAVDLGSTNGTRRNGRSIGRHIPSRLVSGDMLALGKLILIIRVDERPSFQTAILEQKSNLADAMSQIAKAITSQLDLDEVLSQVLETAMLLTSAGETGIWLVDEETGELFLEAERGIEDEKVRRMRLPLGEDTLMGQVISAGETRQAQRQPGEDRIKVKTHYLVEALIYVPVKLEGVTLGVLAAVHREPGRRFKERDEQLLEAIADFAAIAIQNARLYRSTDLALRHRVQELSALNEVAHAVSASLDLDQVYQVLVDQVNRNWPVEAVRLYLAVSGQTELHPHQAQVEGAIIPSIPVGKGIIGKASLLEEASAYENIQANPDFDERFDSCGLQGLRSIACVPLRAQGRLVGVLALFNRVDGAFSVEDTDRLKAFANPVATGIENARLFEESERQRAAILVTARTFSQPLIILDERGDVTVSNQAAERLLKTHMADLFAGISEGVGRTTEIAIGDETYLTTVDRLPGIGTIALMQDITYVQQLEQERSELVHMLSHDLKTPLNSILGWADLLLADVQREEREGYVVNLTNSAGRMRDLIDRMLRTATEADAVQLNRRSCDLSQIVSQVLKDAEGAAMYRSIALSFEQSGKAYPIMADETRLYHLVLNLVDNAVKYSYDNTIVRILLDFTEQLITLRVQDEGPGISEHDMPHLFEKYYRGTHAKRHPGTGLGLSVVWAIAEAHGGRVMVANKPKVGTEFTVILPGGLRLSSEG
jgi:two-component system NtrC family sensor kinase